MRARGGGCKMKEDKTRPYCLAVSIVFYSWVFLFYPIVPYWFFVAISLVILFACGDGEIFFSGQETKGKISEIIRKMGLINSTPIVWPAPIVLNKKTPKVIHGTKKIVQNDLNIANLPKSIDMRRLFPPCVNQGLFNSCTAEAVCGAVMKQNMAYPTIDKVPLFYPSVMFQYYNERAIDGDPEADDGSYITTALKSLNTYGVVPEGEWPYDQKNLTAKPNEDVYKSAVLHNYRFYHIDYEDPASIKATLAAGFPIIFQIVVHTSLMAPEVTKTGVVPLPPVDAGDLILGSHAVLLVGYDDEKQRYIVRNSWGTNWGDNGYMYLPYDYVKDENLASNLWIITDGFQSLPTEKEIPVSEL